MAGLQLTVDLLQTIAIGTLAAAFMLHVWANKHNGRK